MNKQRIVVKIGSSSLTDRRGGLSKEKLEEHVLAIAELKKQGHEVVLISSGAVAAGFTKLGYPARPVTLAGKQAAAAVGQGLLMQGYAEAFQQHGLVVAQLLLTRNDFSGQEQYSNAYATLQELLKRNVIPIVNENDSTSIAELTFGDNDMLSALVSGLVHAHYLIILTDVNGLYNDNPKKNPEAVKYDSLRTITDEMLANADSAGKLGTGGMKSKIEAAKTAVSLGVPTFIGTGSGKNKLVEILSGNGDGTYIGDPEQKAMNNKKQWLAFHSPVEGKLLIDDGAARAVMQHGKSLLPVGVKAVFGTFAAGAVVDVADMEGNIIGRGQVNFSSADLNDLKGKGSPDFIKQRNTSCAEAIHRDHWLAKY
ncbi:glutamate 5-kinase [Evansella caseinilytica]|uniref:Glutamate 5-kinase n=1 Tax=Evansella caseinilytica TaxID=1503961 RepID=A0A1H3NWB4_9BACI|nr:glutamate 5-kinase [Evansella caseinilytica]SDY92815.1 glutamate 5-kinase [Evansella caseinilytica]